MVYTDPQAHYFMTLGGIPSGPVALDGSREFSAPQTSASQIEILDKGFPGDERVSILGRLNSLSVKIFLQILVTSAKTCQSQKLQ